MSGVKHDSAKLPWHLLPWGAVEEVVRVLAFGARKYAPGNYRHVRGWRWRYSAALVRHLVAWVLGQRSDPESKLHHLAHASCCALFLLGMDLERDLGFIWGDDDLLDYAPTPAQRMRLRDLGAEVLPSQRVLAGRILRVLVCGVVHMTFCPTGRPADVERAWARAVRRAEADLEVS